MITEKQVDAALDAYFTGEDWRNALGDALAAARRDMRAALEAASAHSDAVIFRCACGQTFEVRGPDHIVGRPDAARAADHAAVEEG
ncbi:MAG: hypothetical protein HC900_00100 [Methylacidiphilales bacterium]|nr:hypothetical protein [Candidatus Methylacidiphilales bacterium]